MVVPCPAPVWIAPSPAASSHTHPALPCPPVSPIGHWGSTTHPNAHSSGRDATTLDSCDSQPRILEIYAMGVRTSHLPSPMVWCGTPHGIVALLGGPEMS